MLIILHTRDLRRGGFFIKHNNRADTARGDAESESHSFIVKVWIEPGARRRGQVRWRGSISHVPDGVRRCFQDLNTMVNFIAAYLEKMGGRLGPRRRVTRTLKRWLHLSPKGH